MVRVLREDPRTGELPDHSKWYREYNVRDFIIISRDGKSAYEFYIQDVVSEQVFNDSETWEQWRKNNKKDTLSCSAKMWCVIGCESISALLNRYDIKFADMVLTAQWQEIKDPDKTPVRSLVILESKTKQKERARQLEQERVRAQEGSARNSLVDVPDKNL